MSGEKENSKSLAFKYKYPFDLPVCFVRGWKGFFLAMRD